MADLRVLSAGAVKTGVAKLTEAFASESGAPVKVEFTTAPGVRDRVSSGDAFDVVIAPPAFLEDLAKSGKLAAGSRVFLGRSRMGVAVHRDSAIKGIPDVESLKKILVSAPSVVHNKASSGAYAAKLIEKLCPAEAMGSRVVVVESGAAVMEYVAEHGPDAVGLAQISEIRELVAKGLPARLADPLPDDVQNVTSYEAAATSGSGREADARRLAAFLSSANAKAVFAATGID